MKRTDLRAAVDVRPPFEASAAAEARMLTVQLFDEARTEAPLRDVFGPAFLTHQAGVPDLETLLAKAGLPPADVVDRDFLRALGPGTLDRIVQETTEFESWTEFEEAATKAYVARRMLDFVL